MDYQLGLDSGMLLPSKLETRFAATNRAPPRFYLVTALWDEGLVRKASGSGFQGCHRKPVNMVDLFQILQSGRQAGR